MNHKFSATTILSFFLLEESTRSEQAIKDIKKSVSYDERRKKDTYVFSELSTTDEEGEAIYFDPPGSHNTELEAMIHIEQEDIKEELHRIDMINLRYNKLHPTAIQKTT